MGADQNGGERSPDTLRQLRFQNYNPRSDDLKKYCEQAQDPSVVLQNVMNAQEASMAAAAKNFAEPALDLENMVPKKGNWDIKKSLAPKLERLERRTQRAILEIAREKLRRSGDLSRGHDALGPVSSDEE